MKEDNLDAREVLAKPSPPHAQKDYQDLVILKYMAQRIYVTLYLLDEPGDASQPLLYYSEEGRKHIHRIAIYRPEELLLNNSLYFVGVISGKQKPGSPEVIEDIHRVDKMLVVELINTPWLLSYSSLELRDGDCVNVLVFNDNTTR